jgi:uncharacterized protein YggT (Ycf19 family)
VTAAGANGERKDVRHWSLVIHQSSIIIPLDLSPDSLEHTHMRFGMWDTLFNLVLVLLWLRIWAADSRELLFNPFLSPVARIQTAIIEFLKPVLPFLSARIIAAVALVFLMAFRGLAVPRNADWVIRLGFLPVAADPASIRSGLSMSALSFGVFLFSLWGISLLYVTTYGRARRGPAPEAVFLASRPFTTLPASLRPPVLLALGMLLVLVLAPLAGAPAVAADVAPRALALSLRAVLVTLSTWVALLPLIESLLILLIIGSLVSTFTGSPALAGFCHEWISLLIGPLSRYPLRLGLFDLTPLVFIFVLRVVHLFLVSILWRSYQWLA